VSKHDGGPHSILTTNDEESPVDDMRWMQGIEHVRGGQGEIEGGGCIGRDARGWAVKRKQKGSGCGKQPFRGGVRDIDPPSWTLPGAVPYTSLHATIRVQIGPPHPGKRCEGPPSLRAIHVHSCLFMSIRGSVQKRGRGGSTGEERPDRDPSEPPLPPAKRGNLDIAPIAGNMKGLIRPGTWRRGGAPFRARSARPLPTRSLRHEPFTINPE